MGRLTFVGLGLGSGGVSLEGLRAIREADLVYVEHYTSPNAPALLKEVADASGRDVVAVNRNFVEDGKRLLEEAKTSNVVLSVQGDPMLATTHTELRVRAIRAGIPTRVIHGATILSAAASESGLHAYKFGKAITYPVADGGGRATEVYRTIHLNLLRGLHTLLLMEFDVEKDAGVTPAQALRGLQEAESNLKRDVISDHTFAVLLSRIGWEDGIIRAGSFSDLEQSDPGKPPQCVVLPGSLHFTEIEALSAISGIEEGEIPDNSERTRRTAQVLVPRYLEKTKNALKRATEGLAGGYPDLLENVELYMRDAERFLADGEDELAMLGIGYAEGLLDSLTFTDRFELGW